MFGKILLIFGFAVTFTVAYPTGVNTTTDCNMDPGHGHRNRHNQPTSSQPIADFPYRFEVNGTEYAEGTKISVSLNGDEGNNFKGFMVQARDADTDEWIGKFEASENTNGMPECSAITHADPKDKISASFIWSAPEDKSGRVYFIATVVKNYSTFWTLARAAVAAPHGQHQHHH